MLNSSSQASAILRSLLGVALGLTLGLALGGSYTIRALWNELPDVSQLSHYHPKLPLRIYGRDGSLLAEYGEERRELVPIEQIPQHLRQALLAIEDAGFYQHHGVDVAGIVRAAWSNLTAGTHAQGGSTITMQVARQFFLSREKTYRRKIMEVLLAFKLEAAYRKDELLELYMNEIYLGERAYGFAAAASVYFGKGLQDLSLAEAAMLAGLPKAPSAYNPVVNRERAVVRQQYILSRMLDLGWIDGASYEQARTEALTLRSPDRFGDLAFGHPVEQARKLIVEHFGEEAYTRGLDVVLTIDPALQREAMRALRAGLLRTQQQRGYTGPEARLAPPVSLDRNAVRKALSPFIDSGRLLPALVQEMTPTGLKAYLRDGTPVTLAPAAIRGRSLEAGSVIRVHHDGKQGWRLSQLPGMEGALVSIDLHSGEILALAGGFDPRLHQYDHAVQAQRQPGSTFKPFVLSAALERGYFPGTLVEDLQREVTPASGGRPAWVPRNPGNRYDGFTSLRQTLVRSKNVATVNLMEAVGAEYVRDFAIPFGFDPDLNPPVLPLALGSGAISPLGLAQAYAVFGNRGLRAPAVLIARVSQREGPVLYEAAGHVQPVRVISERNAYIMDNLLRDVVERGTGRRALQIGRREVAGKTGTSNNARDVWFAGYSSGLSTVVWMGYARPRSLGRAAGGTHALPVWADFMRAAVAGRPPRTIAQPPDVIQIAGDLAYAEYADHACLPTHHARLASPFQCETVADQAASQPVSPG